MTRISIGTLATLVGLLSLWGCGGGGGDGGTMVPVTNASPGGIWAGVDPVSGLNVTGIVTEAGDFHFLRTDGVQYFGKLTTSQTDVTGSFSGVVPTGFTFADGSTYGTGTVNGTVAERKTLSGSLVFTTHLGNKSTGNISLTFNTLYNSGSALATIAGNYLDPATNTIVNVNGNGVVFDQDPVTGCVINGQVSIIDAHYDAYQVQYSFSSCTGNQAFLNGTTATGLGVLDTTTNPVTAVIGVVNDAAHYVLTAAYQRQ